MLDGLPSELQLVAADLARMGDLSWILDEHQIERIYEPYRAWESRMHEHEGDGFYNCWMLDAGRQVGKTFTTSLIRVEDAIRYPGTRYLMACATEVSLSEFIIPNIDTIIEYLPEDIRPTFLKHHRGMKAGYWFPNGSVLKLVGIDKNPKGLRGPKCDGASIHEAAFPDKLAKIVVSVIQPQFQRGRDPTLILESSAPDQIDHDFDRVFKPSCERRNAYVFMTIDDNTALSPRRKEAILSAAREIDADDTEREYFGKRVQNKIATVFPEIVRMGLSTIKDYQLPSYGVAMTTLDPGQVHLFAVSFSVYDHTRGQVVFIDDWAESNANIEKVAAIVATREYDLWGTLPDSKLARIPLEDDYDASGKLRACGWRSLLAGDRCADRADEMYSLAQAAAGELESTWQWWDAEQRVFMSNPVVRFSDTQLQSINDLSTIYGLDINPTTKDDLVDTMVGNARARISQGRVAWAEGAKLTFAHCKAAQWNKQRTKMAEHPQYGHFDLAADVVYALRNWPNYWHVLPDPPTHVLKPKSDSWVGDIEYENEETEDDYGGDFYG